MLNTFTNIKNNDQTTVRIYRINAKPLLKPPSQSYVTENEKWAKFQGKHIPYIHYINNFSDTDTKVRVPMGKTCRV